MPIKITSTNSLFSLLIHHDLYACHLTRNSNLSTSLANDKINDKDIDKIYTIYKNIIYIRKLFVSF